MAVFRDSIHPQKVCDIYLYTMGELDTQMHMNDIQAAVFFDEKQNLVRLDLTNFIDKEDALAAAELIIAALNIQKVIPLEVNTNKETIH